MAHQPQEGDRGQPKMSRFTEPNAGYQEPKLYEIRIQGHLDDLRAGWFEGWALQREANGETLLTGMVGDQAALYGWLRKVRDLGMPLVSVRCISLGATRREE